MAVAVFQVVLKTSKKLALCSQLRSRTNDHSIYPYQSYIAATNCIPELSIALYWCLYRYRKVWVYSYLFQMGIVCLGVRPCLRLVRGRKMLIFSGSFSTRSFVGVRSLYFTYTVVHSQETHGIH